MSGEIVNLNKARKARAKADAQAQAKANRAKFGRTAGDRLREALDTIRAKQELDRKRRDKADE